MQRSTDSYRSSNAHLPEIWGSVNITNNGTNNGQMAGTINNVGSTVNGGGLSNDPEGFVKAIVDRNTSVVALYLKSGLKATTLYKGASAILFGFQGVPQNGNPVDLVKAFQADGFKVNEELEDSYLRAIHLTGLAQLRGFPWEGPI